MFIYLINDLIIYCFIVLLFYYFRVFRSRSGLVCPRPRLCWLVDAIWTSRFHQLSWPPTILLNYNRCVKRTPFVFPIKGLSFFTSTDPSQNDAVLKHLLDLTFLILCWIAQKHVTVGTPNNKTIKQLNE